MSTREITRHDWRPFFDSFSRQHAGWLCTIEVLGAEIGAQIEAREQPLAGITADVGHGEQDAISIFLGNRSDNHVAHIVHAPAHVWVKETDEGAREGVQIESKTGPATLLRFRSAVLPETVDGVVLDR
jgi:hypothetical protein